MGMFSCQRMRVLQWGQCERGCANVNCGVSMASSSRMSRASARHAAAIICGVRRITTFKKLPSNRPNTKQRSEEHTSELQSRFDLVCRLLLEKKKNRQTENS